MPKKTSPKTDPKPETTLTAEAAYLRLLPQIDAIEDEEVIAISVDIAQAVSTVLGVLPAVEPLQEKLVALDGIHREYLTGLRGFALAALFAHAHAAPMATPIPELRAQLDEAQELRRTLLIDAEALARRGFLDGMAVANVRSAHSNTAVANGLIALSAMLKENWASVASKTAASEQEVERAAVLGVEVLRGLGEKSQAPEPVNRAAQRRAKAFTLLLRAYDEVRRGVTFLRWREGDADTIAPSLYKGRGGRSHKADGGKNGVELTPAAPAVTP